MHIVPLQSAGIPADTLSQPASGGSQKDFVAVLQTALEDVNRLQQEAGDATRALVVGQAPNLHDTMIALEKADISLRFLTQVRNKVVEAYQEIMRMQI
jgi:flagellar hook-basal body complex protein FliE